MSPGQQPGSFQHAATLRDYLQVVRRRKWIIVQATLLVPLAALLFSLQQKPVYQASSDVLLSNQNLASALTGTPDQNAGVAPDRIAQTQATLARVPQIAQRVIAALHLARTPSDFLAHSSVSPATNADILTFTVSSGDASLAARMAAAYARQYTLYRRRLDTASLESARLEVAQRIQALPAKRGALYESLAEKEQQLKTMEALQTSNANVIDTPSSASKISPRPKRNVLLGFVLGLGLGVGLAFLREALDTRVRSAEEISERLALPLLARLPAPPKELRSENKLVMLAQPGGAQAEAFRMLRTNLDFVTIDRRVRTLMITSAIEQEGKTTTASNLAIALARSGQQVALVDLDLRRPFVDKLFDLRGRPGLTQVAVRRATLEDALVRVPLTVPALRTSDGAMRRASAQNGGGKLYVLGSGPIPPDPGEFVASESLSELLDELRERFETVVIDAPPLLHVGDALVLSAKADGLVLVTRIETVRRPMLGELHRMLEPLPTLKLGFVVTGAQLEDGYGYGYGYYSSYHHHAATVQEPLA